MASSNTPRAVGLACFLALPAGVFARWMLPRPAVPPEMPSLVIPHADAEAALAEVASCQVVPGRRHELYLEQGTAEHGRADAPDHALRRRQALLDATSAESVGPARCGDVARGVRVLDRAVEATDAERAAELGSFPSSLETYELVVGGRRVAPRIAIAALFWARWNGLHGLPLADGMSPVLLRAYHGWMVFHARRVPAERRMQALVPYLAAGGLRAVEAEGYLRWIGDDPEGARAAFEAAYRRTGNVRLRNLALGASLPPG